MLGKKSARHQWQSVKKDKQRNAEDKGEGVNKKFTQFLREEAEESVKEEGESKRERERIVLLTSDGYI